MNPQPPAPGRVRRPRYVLGTFWLLIGLFAIIGGISQGSFGPVLFGLLALAYSVYLYRGGRWGLVIW